MPLFFIVSGYFYRPKPLVEQLKVDFRRIFIPYLFIIIITKIFIDLQDIYVGHPVLHPDSPAWFSLALFLARLLYALINIVSPQYKLFVTFALSSISCAIINWNEIPRDIVIISSCFCAVFFLAIGDYVRHSNLLSYLDKNKALSIYISILLWLNTSIFGEVDLHLCIFKLWVVDYAGACAGTYLCYEISRYFVNTTSLSASLLSRLGYYSLVVYSFHAIEYVFPSWFQICALFNCNSLLSVLIIRFSLCCAISWAALKIPPLRQIFIPNIKNR